VMEFVGMRVIDDGKSFEKSFPIDYTCGAAVLVQRAVFEKVGLFDPRYFLYWEDTDFCFRAKRAGFDIHVCPQAKVWHKVSASTSKEGELFGSYFFWRNYLLWIERNLSWNHKIIAYCKLAGMVGKLLVKMLRRWIVFFFSGRNSRERLSKQLAQGSALLCGIKDYFLRRFGAGSSSRFSKNKERLR
jgi:GT2 family glycosyltransferase